MSTPDYYKEENIIDIKVDETWNVLTEIANELSDTSKFVGFDKEKVLIKKFKLALMSIDADRLLIIKDEKQDLQCVGFEGTEELEKYKFSEGESVYFIHIDRHKKIVNEESCYTFESIPVRVQILELSEDGDTISVEFLFDKSQMKCEAGNLCDPGAHVIPRVIGKIDLDSISEWLIYLYSCEVISDNIGLDLKKICEDGLVTDLSSYLEKLCEEFGSYFLRFKAKPGEWLKLYLLLYAKLTNNLLVVVNESDGDFDGELFPCDSEESPLIVTD